MEEEEQSENEHLRSHELQEASEISDENLREVDESESRQEREIKEEPEEVEEFEEVQEEEEETEKRMSRQNSSKSSSKLSKSSKTSGKSKSNISSNNSLKNEIVKEVKKLYGLRSLDKKLVKENWQISEGNVVAMVLRQMKLAKDNLKKLGYDNAAIDTMLMQDFKKKMARKLDFVERQSKVEEARVNI